MGASGRVEVRKERERRKNGAKKMGAHSSCVLWGEKK